MKQNKKGKKVKKTSTQFNNTFRVLTFHNSIHLTFNGFSFVRRLWKSKVYPFILSVFFLLSKHTSSIFNTITGICFNPFHWHFWQTKYWTLNITKDRDKHKIQYTHNRMWTVMKLRRTTTHSVSTQVSIQVKTGNSPSSWYTARFSYSIQLNHLK